MLMCKKYKRCIDNIMIGHSFNFVIVRKIEFVMHHILQLHILCKIISALFFKKIYDYMKY